MTITTNPSRDEYTSTAGQTVFNYTFKIYANTDLNVYVTPSGQSPDDSADLTTDYVVDTGTIGDEAGGFITFNTPLNNGDAVTIVSAIPYDRTVDYQNNGDFLPETVNNDNDRQVSQIKQILEQTGRTLQFQESLQGASTLSLPDPVSQNFMRWKTDLTGLENVDLVQGALVVADGQLLIFPTVAALKASTSALLVPGVNVQTQGYHSAGDGGGCDYLIQTAAEFGGTPDEEINFTLNNGNIAVNQSSGLINVLAAGAVADRTTDNTDLIITAINHAYNNGLNVEIPNGVKWFETLIENFASGTVAATDATTITGVNTQGRDMTGAFVWNITDNSFGIVESYTATTITVEELRLGTLNTFTAGDEYQISLLKVDVNLFDESLFDPYSAAGAGTFTGQSKVFLNSFDPDKKSANERWAWGQYHPGFVAALHEPGNVSGRASFLARRYNGNNKIQSFLQFGLNPVRPTDPITSPGAAADILLVTGHNEGVQTNNATTFTAMGVRMSNDMAGQYIHLGGRAEDNTTLKVSQSRNEDLVTAFNANGSKKTILDFRNDDVSGRKFYHWQTLSGFSGYNSIVVERTANLLVDSDLYSDATFANVGATGNVTITMPNAAPVGYTQEFVVDQAFNLIVSLQDGVFYGSGDSTRRSSTVGSTLRIKRITDANWAILNETGTWAT